MIKRFFDIMVSMAGLILLSPFLFWVALRIRAEDGGEIFYRGVRVGLNGKPFRIFKFRSMVVNAEVFGISSTAEDDPRITQIGSILRKYKIDEIPQLINVLMGEMSMVGPRPQVKWAVDLFSEEERRILSVRPGITDYASLLFQNEGEILKGSADPDRDYLEKIHPIKTKLELQYVRERSLWIDLKIMFKTVFSVLGNRKVAVKV